MPISFGKWHVRLGKSFAAGGKCGSSSASYAKFWEVGQSFWLKLEAPHTPSPNLKLQEDESGKTGHERLPVYFLSLWMCYVHSDEQTQLGRTADDIGTGTVVFIRLTL